MHIHIVSLFPESVRPYLDTSIMKRAQEKGLFSYSLYNLTDWTVRATRRVDDRPYWWGAGTVITIEPLVSCLRDIIRRTGEIPILLMSPRGKVLSAEKSESLAHMSTEYIIICGHYEGVDARIFEFFHIEEVSIGEYVLSSGELAALVVIDSVVRLIPGVITDVSLEEESFSKKLWGKKEYPQYSRPEVFEGKSVPDVLLSGDHKKIEEWKRDHLGS